MPWLHRLTLSLVLAALVVLPCRQARAALYGDATFSYRNRLAEVDGATVQEGSSFLQRYTVGYKTQGLIAGGRGGSYSLMIGGECNVLDVEQKIDGVDDPRVGEVQTAKLLYRGNLVVAPGGLPFRLRLFSQDVAASSPSVTPGPQLIRLPVGEQYTYGTMLGENRFLTYDITNGQRVSSGASLILGIQNGRYLGAYRESLSKFPRLLIDYNEMLVDDTHGQLDGGTHYRDRNLAFVSLNKKENWVHYRVHEYTDYLKPGDNSYNSMLLIGTVDEALDRHWINLTNWIKLSSDGSYSTQRTRSQAGRDKDYDLNFFLQGAREGAFVSSMNTFSRHEKGDVRNQSLELPQYLRMEIDRDTLINARLVVDRDVRSSIPVGGSEFEEVADTADVYFGLFPVLQRTRQYILRPDLQMERKYGSGGEGVGLRTGLEVGNPLRARTLLNGAYHFTFISGTDNLDRSGSAMQHELEGRWESNLSSSLRTGARSTITVASGDSVSNMTSHISLMSSRPMEYGSGATTPKYTGQTSIRHSEELFAEHRAGALANRLTVGIDAVDNPESSETQIAVEHKLSYERQSAHLELDNVYITGDKVVGHSSWLFDRDVSVYFNSLTSYNDLNNILQSSVKASYTPTRAFYLQGSGSYQILEWSDIAKSGYLVTETAGYRLYEQGGEKRLLGEISEKIGYQSLDKAYDGNRDTVLYTGLSGKIMPTRILALGGDVTHLVFGPTGAAQQVYSAWARLRYEKLEMGLTFSQGYKDAEGTGLPEVMERFVSIDVKKTF